MAANVEAAMHVLLFFRPPPQDPVSLVCVSALRRALPIHHSSPLPLQSNGSTQPWGEESLARTRYGAKPCRGTDTGSRRSAHGGANRRRRMTEQVHRASEGCGF